MRRLLEHSSQGTALRLFLLALLVYNINLRSVTSADTNPTRYLPISILTEFDLDLDEFGFLFDYSSDRSSADGVPYFLTRARGHFLSNYPVMPAILSLPVYALPVALGVTSGSAQGAGYSQTEIIGTLLSKASASAAVAASVALVYLSLLRLADRRSALTLALVYAFGTSSWAVSSQGLWQTAFSQPLVALALYCLVRAREQPSYVPYAGVALALSVACRPPNVVIAAVFLVYVLHRHRDQALKFLLGPAVVALLLIGYNLVYFANPVGGYTNVGAATQFTAPRGERLLGLLVSPSRGLLTYSPVLLFSCVGLATALRRRGEPLLAYTAVATLMTLVLYSAWEIWYGAFSYSYRFLVDLLPGLILLTGVVHGAVLARPWLSRLFVACAVFSVLVQAVGAFNYPCGWYETPVRAATAPERFWDWRDSEFVRCLRTGPVEPDGLRLIRDLARRS